ncbi:hypothetical protein L484_010608 [Morus notabilis]|uniref:HMA domain-containing protein n=1 Tax=Morus notabilis TaxID=981085 RepID=W9QE03_9ROSA|nr:heavy metal-associated isoprenylated plant protein 7 [Morus notabilis]EXB29549.1 hypothetical protein L484_010608 [Morus notabilis]
MGEENKEEKKEEEKKEERKEEKKEEEKKEEKKEEEPPVIVLKVDMHCEACARKVARALKGFEGVEEVTTDSKTSKVIVKGKAADPIKVCERLQKKSGRKVELISPLPKPPEENKETKEEKKEQKEEEKKEEPPTPITVILKVRMHCEACAQVLQKRIRKIKGVDSVETDLGNDQVIVKGIVDPAKLVDDVYKKTKKQASVVPEEKKVEEKKEEEKKEEKEGEKKEGEEGKGEEDKKSEVKKSEYWPSKYYLELEYAYPPTQIFSDENPNACSVM